MQQQHTAQNIKSRGGKLWLKLAIPRSLRQHYLSASGKPRTHVEESLGTGDLTEAKRARDLRVAHWVLEFDRVRRGGAAAAAPASSTDLQKALRTAHEFREAMNELHDRPDPRGTLNNEGSQWALDDLVEATTRHIEATQGTEAGDQFHSIATTQPGKLTMLQALAKWNAGEDVRKGTKLKRVHAVGELLAFCKVPDCLPSYVTEDRAVAYVDWLNGLGLGYSTKQDRLSNLQTLWKYLGRLRQVPRGVSPWTDHALTKGNETEPPVTLRAWTDEEIIKLLQAPERPRLHYTRALFRELYVLGFTIGARENSLVSLTPSAIQQDEATGALWLSIDNDKTDAGTRVIPVVHPAAVAVLNRRRAAQQNAMASLFPECRPGGPDGHLSWQVQKALGRDRDALEFGPEVTFHSTRRNFITLLDNSGVEVVHVQRYIGHTVPSLMHGLYSSGASRENLLKVAKAVRYSDKVEAEFLKV